ncbi:dysbindin domain-containing protein 1 isoform X3 [Mustela lutreola]|uniref:Dysbindin domain-containing protein 1 n=3 Tax=Mustela TaxID=9665 RepID=A0A8U0UZW3_MUSPF|nr:dysbindin domain-containing protein 1 isoform X1 [Mustela erminea]XP_044932441.1 dysbindin domain-containing protein 1 isoform X2 [Mustela putorius furo]XP_059007624.1 dysbindin domain-containing protein 1 isoform X3 [Mustela lutreola]
MLGGTRAPEQLRAPPRGLLPAAAAPRLLPRCAAPGAGAESPPQLQGRPGWVTPPPPAPLPDPAGRMEPPEGAGPGEIVKDVEAPQAALGTLAHGTGDSCHSPTAEEEVGIPIPAPGLLQVTERRQPLSSVSSLEVHFDLLDLTELTDMSDQELAEVFADSDDESLAGESPAGLHPLPRAGCLRSPSWTRTRAEQNREKQPLGDPERRPAIADTFLTVERPKED